MKTIISNQTKRSLKLVICLLISSSFALSGCKKYIDVGTPPTVTSSESAFSTDAGATQVLTGIFADMSNYIENGKIVSACILPELSADNLKLFDPETSPQYADYYRNSLEPQYLRSGQASTFWAEGYKAMFTINTAIKELTGNSKLTPKVANRLLGEAHFMRAFYYFYLVNFYSEVPLVLTTSYQQNSVAKKNSSAEIYSQILADLQIAEGLLDYTYASGDILKTTGDRVRPNRAAVNALQSRVYLYQKNYSAAEIAATKVISQSQYALTSLDGTFIANSSETIWSLQPVEIGYNTKLAFIFILPLAGPNGFDYPFYISESLINSFEPGDARKEKWLGISNTNGTTYYYPNKYKIGFIPDSKMITEYTIVLRLAEQYLIRAEARNELDNTTGAIEDLNAIRNRSRAGATASVPNPLPILATTLSQLQVRPIILKERRLELFTEWGHRWFDLRRSGTLDAVMTAEATVKSGTWSPYKSYYPIPQNDITRDRGLTQTPGYN